MEVAVLVAASLLIVGGVAWLLRSPVVAGGSSTRMEGVWTLLPILFLAVLLGLTVAAL